MASGSAFLLAVLLQARAPLAVRERAIQFDSEASGEAECGRAVAEPPTGEDLQSYFDGLRVSLGILNESTSFRSGLVDPATCTKKDVCLLMRQLDMDFYERAREGTLTDHDYDTPPTLSWHMSGTCASMSRGYKVVPVELANECKRAVKAKGAGSFTEVSSQSLPTGCVIVHNQDTGKKEAYLNIVETDVEAGMQYAGSSRVPKQVMQLCSMDRSLSESAASYYSPYKLKPSMEGREAHSTSCSFGMMAFLAKLRETMSPCAKIITYQTDSRFHSAAHALQVAAALEKRGAQGERAAAHIRQYVETVRQKYVLIDTIANHWCPGVWTAAKAKPGATCDVPRVAAWTEEGAKLAEAQEAAEKASGGRSPGGRKSGGRKGGRQPTDGRGFEEAGNQGLLDDLDALLAEFEEEDTRAEGLHEHADADDGRSDSRGKPIKIALNEDSCEAFEDESLASRLADAPEAPPDFFRDATLPED